MRTAIARHIRSAVVAPVALAATIVLAAAPVAAQDLSTGAVRPAPTLAIVREVGKFRIVADHADGLPAEVTLIDRAGTLAATYRLPGDRVAQPMMVTLIDSDIILQAETDKGVLTLQLFGQNDEPTGGKVNGRWTLGSRSGELRGRSK